MKLFLIWELGRGHGHQLQLEWLAEGLRARGHQVTVVSPGESGFRHFFNTPTTNQKHKSWADLLLVNGFADDDFISARLKYWRDFINHEKPDAVILDHAPYAHLVACALRIPCMEFGSAFTIPIPSQPVGIFDNSTAPFQEAALIERVNRIFADHGWQPLPDLATLYRYSRLRCATGIPMLDHYGPRTDIAYTGAFAAGRGKVMEWGDQSAGKIKLFIYWRDGTGLTGFLQKLNRKQVIVRGYAPELSKPIDYADGWNIGSQPWDLNSFTADTLPDFALGYASNAFIQWMAHLGVPQLMAPIYREGLMQGNAAQQLGLGLLCSNSSAEDIAQKFTLLVSNPDFRKHSAAFSHYSRSHWDASPRLAALCQLIEQTFSV